MNIRLGIAIATSAICSVASPLYMLGRVEPFPAVELFLTAGPYMTVILWLCQDARRRGVGAVHDLGFFLMLSWPVVIPWYAFASRGRGGWKLLLGLTALIAAPIVTSAILAWFPFR